MRCKTGTSGLPKSPVITDPAVGSGDRPTHPLWRGPKEPPAGDAPSPTDTLFFLCHHVQLQLALLFGLKLSFLAVSLSVTGLEPLPTDFGCFH